MWLTRFCRQQTGFILHLAQHWFPLRRFAPNPPHGAAIKRWYNLNSFLQQPEWISPTYLKMVLTQAEQEGYSVFVVRRTGTGKGQGGEGMDLIEGEGWGDAGVGIMPECLADTMAVELGEPVGRAGQAPSSTAKGSAGPSVNPDAPSVDTAAPSGSSTPPVGPSRRPKRQEDLLPDNFSDVDSPPRPAARSSRSARQRTDPMSADDDMLDAEMEAARHPTDFSFQSRSYDDEDAALQAALKASMEDVPAGWVAPDFSKQERKPIATAPVAASAAAGPDPKLQAAFPMAKKPAAAEPKKQDAGPGTPQVIPAAASGSRFREEIEEDDDDQAGKAEVLSPGTFCRSLFSRGTPDKMQKRFVAGDSPNSGRRFRVSSGWREPAVYRTIAKGDMRRARISIIPHTQAETPASDAAASMYTSFRIFRPELSDRLDFDRSVTRGIARGHCVP